MIPTILILLFFFLPTDVFAIYDPLAVPNNKYGIHVADTNDIPDTAPLVNSSGGDWGYVTLVIQDNDQDPGKWQKIFNHMRRLHLIPLVRLATHPRGDSWNKPNPSDASTWARFLGNLNWPIENRYVIVFNEPNHAKEWGGGVNPQEYGEVFVSFAKELHAASPDFFVLPAGLDAAASSTADTMDMAAYLRDLMSSKPEFFDLVDGWTSHSYPNPAFSGSPLSYGKGTIRSFEWELDYARSLGLTKNLPVFITETGWLHNQGSVFNPSLLSTDAVGAHIELTAATVWQNPNVVAVTPFIFSYQGLPFDHFSWKKLGSSEYYSHYFAYRDIPKHAGLPKQHHAFSLSTSLFPDTLVASSNYDLEFTITNTGQAIIGKKEGYALSLEPTTDFEAIFDSLRTFEPGESITIGTKIRTRDEPGDVLTKLFFTRDTERYLLEEKTLSIIPPPSLQLTIPLGWRRNPNAMGATVLVYDHETLLHKFSGVTIKDGVAEVFGLTDIVPGKSYRVVILVPFYLPGQSIKVLGGQTTTIKLHRLFPFDLNRDGALTVQDLMSLIRMKPNAILPLFFGP